MKVRAKRLGYYGLQRRREGDVFILESEKQFSHRWMEKVEETAPVEKAKPKVSERKPAPFSKALPVSKASEVI